MHSKAIKNPHFGKLLRNSPDGLGTEMLVEYSNKEVFGEGRLPLLPLDVKVGAVAEGVHPSVRAAGDDKFDRFGCFEVFCSFLHRGGEKKKNRPSDMGEF